MLPQQQAIVAALRNMGRPAPGPTMNPAQQQMPNPQQQQALNPQQAPIPAQQVQPFTRRK
jgi:hypothetical protein